MLWSLIMRYMWCLQYTINYVWSKIRWAEGEVQRYYTIVVTPELRTKYEKYKSYDEKVESTRECLRRQKKKFEEFKYWDKKSKRWLIGFRVYYTAKRRAPELPEYKTIYGELRPKLLAMWKEFAAHYVDSIIQYAYKTVMKSWQELYGGGMARKKKPVMKRRTIYIKNTLFRVKNGELMITLVPRKHYLSVPLEGQWFLQRVNGWKLGAVLIKEIIPRRKYRIILQYTMEREGFEPKAYLSIDLNMDTIDLLLYAQSTNTKLWLQIDWSSLVRWIQRHGERLDKTRSTLHHNRKKLRHKLRKLGARYNHYTSDIIKKLANYIVRLAQLYNALIIVEDLRKQSMYNNSRKKNRELGFRLWKRLVHHIQGQWYVREVDPYKTTKKCCICGKDAIVQGLQVYCPKCRHTIDRQLNAIINILQKGTGIRVKDINIKREIVNIKDIS